MSSETWELIQKMSVKDAELQLALKPHLKEERQKKVDKAVKILKLLSIWSVLRDSGMLKDFL